MLCHATWDNEWEMQIIYDLCVRSHTHTNTCAHTQIHLYVYIYIDYPLRPGIRVCVCGCVGVGACVLLMISAKGQADLTLYLRRLFFVVVWVFSCRMLTSVIFLNKKEFILVFQSIFMYTCIWVTGVKKEAPIHLRAFRGHVVCLLRTFKVW